MWRTNSVLGNKIRHQYNAHGDNERLAFEEWNEKDSPPMYLCVHCIDIGVRLGCVQQKRTKKRTK